VRCGCWFTGLRKWSRREDFCPGLMFLTRLTPKQKGAKTISFTRRLVTIISPTEGLFNLLEENSSTPRPPLNASCVRRPALAPRHTCIASSEQIIPGPDFADPILWRRGGTNWLPGWQQIVNETCRMLKHQAFRSS